MSEREKIEKAISALESQRAILGEEVVETALRPLRDALAALRDQSVEPQRKYITVLFADIQNFTTLSEKIDAEEMGNTLNAIWERLDPIILENGGRIDKHMGNGILALWGATSAREDDPEQAIRAGLAMQGQVQAWNENLSSSPFASLRTFLHLRIGIHSGLVMLGEMGITGEYTAMGDTVNTASRIQTTATAGELLISHDAYRHVRGVFEVRPLDPIYVKGKTAPLRLYMVKSAKPRAFRDTNRGVEGIETSMVGREPEMRRLQQAYETCVEKQLPQVVTVVGEIGVGKSRLLYEFTEWLDLLPIDSWFLKGRAIPQTKAISFALLRDMIDFRLDILESDPMPVVQQKLESGLARIMQISPDLSSQQANQTRAHFVGALLGYDFSNSPHLAGIWNDPRQLYQRALNYIAEIFTSLARSDMVVVLLDDIHWADDHSLDAIAQILQQCGKIPLMVVCAARASLYEHRPDWGKNLPAHQRIDLQPISPSDSLRLAGEILQYVDEMPIDLLDLIAQRAEGNPYYVEELIKMLIDDGVILRTTTPWQVRLDRLVGLHIPPTLRGVLQARLDDLPGKQKVVLQRASVLGRTFWDSALVSLASRNTDHLQKRLANPAMDADTRRALEELTVRELIFKKAGSTFKDTDEFTFKHNLLRDVAYESVLRRDRRIYHARAARWLADVSLQRGRADEYATLIAEHYEQAGESASAAEWYRRAGMQAWTRYAHKEALHCLGKALDLLPVEPSDIRFDLFMAREQVYHLLGQRSAQAEDLENLNTLMAQRQSFAPLTTRQKASVSLRWAAYFSAVADYPAGSQSAQTAVQLSQSGGLVDLEATGRLEWGEALWRQSDYAAAKKQLEQALLLARQTGQVNLESACLRNLGTVADNQGDYPSARSFFEQALAISRQIGDQRNESGALISLGNLNLDIGEYEAAQSQYEQGLLITREIGDRRGEGRAFGNLGFIASDQGDYARSRKYFEQARQLFQELGDKLAESVSLLNLGNDCMSQGDYQAACEYVQQALHLQHQIGNRQGECVSLDNLSLIYYHLGEYEKSLEYSSANLISAQELGIPSTEAFAYHHRGHALAALNDLDGAAQAYQQALQLRTEISETMHAIESLAGLAQVTLSKGDLAAALAIAGQLIEHLDSKGSIGMVEPLWVHWVCYQILQAGQDQRAVRVLSDAYRILHLRAAQITDEALQHSFLTNIRVHRNIIAVYEAARD